MKKPILTTAAAVVAAGTILTVTNIGRGSSAVAEIPEEIDASGRTWRTDVLRPDPTTFPHRGDELLRPEDVIEGPNGQVYILDFGDLAVKQFSPGGEFVRRFGRGRGGGPGELLNPTHFQIASNGEVWILDPAQGRIQVFEPNGNYKRVVRIETPAPRFALHPDGSYTLLAASDSLFHRFATDGAPLRSFGRVIENQVANRLALEGELAPVRDGGVVYTPLRAGYIARFGPSGLRLYHRSTIEPRPYPEIEVLPSGGRMVRRDLRNVVSTKAVSVAGNEIWTLAVTRLRGQQRWIIDVYDLANGAYRYSLLSPEQTAVSMHVTPRHLYIVGETSVRRWARRH